MRCPACSERDTRVVDSRDLDDSATIRRRRECNACSARFTTYERVESARLSVVKRAGERQEFDRQKLAAGLEKALWRRPVPAGTSEEVADGIEATLRGQGIGEVASARIGQMAMERLRQLDQIALVRYMSVHQRLEGIDQLKREVDRVHAQRGRAAPGQTTLSLDLPPVVVAPAAAATRRRGGRS
ncbi:MAG: transcriptional repressor NrdR [Chloroflexi bacterium]|nr:transcriptional repressor NrdR [Chloroflexota bacterium]